MSEDERAARVAAVLRQLATNTHDYEATTRETWVGLPSTRVRLNKEFRALHSQLVALRETEIT